MDNTHKTMTARDQRNGQYTFSRMERPCRCGHTLGEHSSGAPHDCLVGTFTDATGNFPARCESPKFRPVKAVRP